MASPAVLFRLAGLLVAGAAQLSAQTYSFTTWVGPYASGFADGDGRTAQFGSTSGIVADDQGNLFVVDAGNYVIRKISPDAHVTTFVGLPGAEGSADGTGAQARFSDLTGLAIDAQNNLFALDRAGVRRITPAGVVTTFPGAAALADGYFLAVDRAGNILASSAAGVIRRVTPNGVASILAGAVTNSGYADGAGSAARFAGPAGIAIDANGTAFVADSLNQNIRAISPAGVVSTFAGSNVLTARAVGPGGAVVTGTEAGHVDATGTAARFHHPGTLAIDSTGNLYVTELWPVIRKITPAGAVTTIAGTSEPSEIRDGVGTAARFSQPASLTVDRAGTIYLVDRNTIRRGIPVVAPAVQTQPVERVVAPGNSASFAVNATGGALTYQWSKDGLAIPGATQNHHAIAAVTPADAGAYSVVVQNPLGSAFSAMVALRVDENAARLVNLSVRTRAGDGNDALTLGFVVGGRGEKNLLVRGIGPTLAQFGVAGTLTDPRLAFFEGTALIAANDNWGGDAALAATFGAVGAFGLPATSTDAALARSFSARAYTVQVNGAASTSGVVLAELYDLDRVATGPRLRNLSARSVASSGDGALTAGFVVSGTGSVRLLIRGVGPALASFGVASPLADPRLRVRTSAGTVLAENDDWSASPIMTLAAESTGAFSLPNGSKDAALIVTLFASAYTAEITGVDPAAAGPALIEVFELP